MSAIELWTFAWLFPAALGSKVDPCSMHCNSFTRNNGFDHGSNYLRIVFAVFCIYLRLLPYIIQDCLSWQASKTKNALFDSLAYDCTEKRAKRTFWAMNFERLNGSFKRPTHIMNNFRNPLLTLAYKHQCAHLWRRIWTRNFWLTV